MKEVLLTSSALILALLLVRRAFREKISRRVQYALWGLVLLRLLIPVQLPAVDFSLLSVAEPAAARVEETLAGNPIYVLPVSTQEIAASSARPNVILPVEGRYSAGGEYGALVLAGAGLKRLGLESRISRYFDTEEMIPAAGQGILAVQGRRGGDYSYLKGYECRESRYAALAERGFVRELDGGCTSPVAAHARITGEELYLKGLYYRESTEEWFTDQVTGAVEEAEALGRNLAGSMRERYGV